MSMLLSLLSGTWTRLAGIVAGIVLLVVGIRKSGADSVKATVEKERADTLSRMSDADASGARSKRDILERLRGHGL